MPGLLFVPVAEFACNSHAENKYLIITISCNFYGWGRVKISDIWPECKKTNSPQCRPTRLARTCWNRSRQSEPHGSIKECQGTTKSLITDASDQFELNARSQPPPPSRCLARRAACCKSLWDIALVAEQCAVVLRGRLCARLRRGSRQRCILQPRPTTATETPRNKVCSTSVRLNSAVPRVRLRWPVPDTTWEESIASVHLFANLPPRRPLSKSSRPGMPTINTCSVDAYSTCSKTCKKYILSRR